MPIAVNGGVSIYYETFGSPSDPTLLLVNGLGSQCTNFAEEWCGKFAAQGYQVVRFDNRDVGLSTKLDGVEYALTDMAADALAVLDDLGVGKAHVMGLSLGGMIVQRLAIDHPDRLLTMTSAMSRTGESDSGQTTAIALGLLLARPARSRQEYVDGHLKGLAVYGSKPEWIDEDEVRARAAASYDRCFCPEGRRRQMAAAMADGSRAEALRRVTVPTLVLHGSRDTLIDPSGGRRTAELVPGARYVEIDGMGHDYPPAVWDLWVATWSDFVQGIAP
jgi:pimeloyl-ACP methyl ester carboxylesterase